MAVTRVAVLDDYQQRADGYADWASLGPDVTVSFFSEPIGADALAATLADFEVLVLMRERTALRREVLAALPKLRLLITTGMRNASVDTGYLNERGVIVCGTGAPAGPAAPGVPSTVEVAWALILAVCKRVTIEDRAIRDGRWQLGLPANLAGATLGLAGLGRLGGAMVGPARAFGMDVIAWSENLTAERAASLGVRRVTKAELLSGSDILSIHLVLSDRTRGLLGAGDLAQMKPTAVLINTSRGPIVSDGRARRRAAQPGHRGRRAGCLRSRAAAGGSRARPAGQRRAPAAPGLRQRGRVPADVRAGRRGHRRLPGRLADPHHRLGAGQ